MKIYFVRHADKAKGDFYNTSLGHRDQPISSLGRRQARQLRKRFRREPIVSIHVSEYRRTLETARPLARKLRLLPAVDARLNEIDPGDAEMLTFDELKVRYPETWHALNRTVEDFRWPGGETGAEAQARGASFLAEIARIPGDKLVVAHDGIIRLLLCHLLGIDVVRRFDLRVDTCGILEIERSESEDRWRVVRFNQGL